MVLPRAAAGAVDALLELSVVGSFSRLGPWVRRRTDDWSPPRPIAGTFVVTGATSGIGLAVATALAQQGATVCMVGRDAQRLEAARQRVQATAAAAVMTERADLGDLSEVAEVADRITRRVDRLDGLVHGAGALLRQRQLAKQGNEMTVTVQLLAPYVLTERLLPVLGEAPGRVITVTSGGLYTQPFDLEKLADAVSGPYNGATVYARVKRAQTVLTHAWQQWHHGTGVRFHTMHPGWVDTPGLAAGLPDFYRFMKPLLRTPAEGADTVAWLCEEPAHGPEGGRLWLDRRPRSEYHAPWTWVAPERRLEQQAAVVRWCQDQTEAFVPVVHDW